MEHSDKEVLSLLDRILLAGQSIDTVEEGWKTASEMAQMFGRSTTATGRLLKAGVDRGILEKKSFKVLLNGMPRHLAHYREIK